MGLFDVFLKKEQKNILKEKWQEAVDALEGASQTNGYESYDEWRSKKTNQTMSSSGGEDAAPLMSTPTYEEEEILDESSERLKGEILKFKMELLQQFPFYGDIAMRMRFEEDNTIPTAATNGMWIRYNKKFMLGLKAPQRNYVLMHEILHVLMMHWKRSKEKDPAIWNIACDLVVNSVLDRIKATSYGQQNGKSVNWERPPEGLFLRSFWADNLVEDIYFKILEDNQLQDGMSQNGTGGLFDQLKNKNRKLILREHYAGNFGKKYGVKIPVMDLHISEEDLSEAEKKVLEKEIKTLVKESLARNRSSIGDYHVPSKILSLVETKRLPWKRLLQDYLEVTYSDESSYLTPERKYIHMDLIVPGVEMKEDELGEVWAFVDSSGSIRENDLNQFLTQLYRISKEYSCVMNIAYWDTEVTDVYKKISKKQNILDCKPHHSGGTEINCVYRYLEEEKIKPTAMLILTDGYFGKPNEKMAKKYKKNTILVLTKDNPKKDYSYMGKIAEL